VENRQEFAPDARIAVPEVPSHLTRQARTEGQLADAQNPMAFKEFLQGHSSIMSCGTQAVKYFYTNVQPSIDIRKGVAYI
jgi:hypothetical protein